MAYDYFAMIKIILSAMLIIITVLAATACEGRDPTPTPEPTKAPPSPTVSATDPPTAEPTAVPTPEPTPTFDSSKLGPQAAEITRIDAWINSDPLKISDLRGQVVLIDFWTYTCVNCVRTLPYLREWHAKYADHGLVMIGVHTPEFEFEKDFANVKKAVEDFEIEWAVALDNDYGTWRAYENRYWPAKYLIDQNGVVRYTHFGEGAYAETEETIRRLLEESGSDLSQVAIDLPEDQRRDQAFLDRGQGITRELYAGWERGYNDAIYGRGGYIGNPEYYDSAETVMSYADPGSYRENMLYLIGEWYAGNEEIVHSRETTGYEDSVFLRFNSKSVNVVFKPQSEGETAKVLVTLDGAPLTESAKGADILIDENGQSYINVDEPRMYAVVEADEYGSHDLRLSSNNEGLAIFAYTFGIYEAGI